MKGTQLSVIGHVITLMLHFYSEGIITRSLLSTHVRICIQDDVAIDS